MISKLRIGPHLWKIQYLDKVPEGEKEGAWYGDCECSTNTIRILKSTVSNMFDTLIHEVLHACLFTAGVCLSDRTEEDVVRGITPFLIEALNQL